MGRREKAKDRDREMDSPQHGVADRRGPAMVFARYYA